MIKALVVEVSFFEALFKVHYTKGFRQSYLIPLPTSVAGIFGAMLGISRNNLHQEFHDILFGAAIKRYKGIVGENVTFFQDKPSNPTIGVAKTLIVNEPTYVIAMSGSVNRLEVFMEKLSRQVEYLPYGGQNDFFVKDFQVHSNLVDVENCDIVNNYAPSSWVDEIKSDGKTEIQILPVMHKLDASPNFHFILDGSLKLSRTVSCVKAYGIGLYSLHDFYLTGDRN
ncbi:putative CRISPR-associated protein, Cas5 family [Candidatus Nitrososphaera gargensis Ga9.2]|uniref:Putative CRISPR-associated protein, Cas5 family n=1 Tax=Nitrososphaera gargensis (strain Ga9.2) TaxID=1237085 RepID=K0IEW1_NITGG|nr:CRISPR-associated protein Cas5 [Candidatus Nitrososphaera gargensis]AFU57333.1 putative CRISPR-associated protein, Cas5 family [Candidatus Nitrososphaera gargensis Ga9.2]